MTDTVGAMTLRLLTDAGIGPGMRVLDVGCGRGDVSLLASGLVGPKGSVVGIDRDAAVLAIARGRATELGLDTVTFVEGDFGALAVEHGYFDAAVGRRVLMYQPDPVDAIRRLAHAIAPGGLVVFQEHDATMPPTSLAPMPLHQRVHEWIWRTVEREGANLHMGFGLAAALDGAGLHVVDVRAEAIVQTPWSPYPLTPIVRAMLSRIADQRIATAAEIEIDTLERRLAEECARMQTTYVGELVFGAWARTPT